MPSRACFLTLASTSPMRCVWHRIQANAVRICPPCYARGTCAYLEVGQVLQLLQSEALHARLWQVGRRVRRVGLRVAIAAAIVTLIIISIAAAGAAPLVAFMATPACISFRGLGVKHIARTTVAFIACVERHSLPRHRGEQPSHNPTPSGVEQAREGTPECTGASGFRAGSPWQL